MSLEIECALLGVASGAVVMPVLYYVTERCLGYMQDVHGIQAREVSSGE